MLITVVSCGQKKTAEVDSKEKVVPNIERHLTVLSQRAEIFYYHLRHDDFNSEKIYMETIAGDGSVRYIYKYDHFSTNDTLAISGTTVTFKNNNLFLIKEKKFMIDGKTLYVGKYLYEGDNFAAHMYIDKSKGFILRHELFHNGLVEYHVNNLPESTFRKIMKDSTFFYVNSHNLRE